MLSTHRNLSPGGVLEVQDISFNLRSDDGSLPKDAAFAKWAAYMLEASIQLGCPLDSVESVKSLMLEAGFVDIEQKAYCWPQNQWPKDPRLKKIGGSRLPPLPLHGCCASCRALYPGPDSPAKSPGLWTFHNFTASLSGISLALFTRGLSWSPEELEAFLVDVRKDMRNTAFHAYWPM